MRILTAAEARQLDRAALKLGVPGLVLMENAGRGAAEWVNETAPQGAVVVLCGPGNNGGDGLGIARHLHSTGRSVRALMGAEELSEDARAQQRWCRQAGVELGSLTGASLGDALQRQRVWVVDALFGTGLNRPLKTPWSHWIEELAGLRSSGAIRGVLAVDLPSGLDADLAAPIGPHVVADATVTFAAEKPACLLSPNAEACGAVSVVALGFEPRALLGTESLERIDAARVAELLPLRPAGGHKGTFGHLLVVGGSGGMGGAPALTGRAALRSGAGLVTVGAPRGIAEHFSGWTPEALTLGLTADVAQCLTLDAVDEVLERLQKCDALALGPGLGSANASCEAARRIALESDKPLVLDADGLNAFAGKLEAIAARRVPTVLTPHPGELARLLEWDREKIVADPLTAAAAAVDASGQVVVLKGAATVIAAPEPPIAIVREGNSGMATAGSGDVLTGIIGALLAQNIGAGDAARIAVWAHGSAGAEAAAGRSQAGLIAGDLIESLSRVWARFER